MQYPEGERATVRAKERDHISSRHRDWGDEDVVTESGDHFEQGDLFPRWMNTGDIRRLEKFVYLAWRNYHRGQPEKSILDIVKRSDGSQKLRLRLKSAFYGIKEVKAIIKQGTVVSVSPSRTTGSNFLQRGDEKMKKSRGHNRSFSPVQ